MRLLWTYAIAGLAALVSIGEAAPVSSQSGEAPRDDVAGRYIRVRLDRRLPPASPGRRLKLSAEIVPGPKIHVYAPGQRGYIPVTLTVTPAAGLQPAAPKYPPARDLYFEPLRETVKVYDQPFRITQEIALSSTPDLRRRAAARETLAVAATLTYQACDDAVCYRPETLTFSWKVPLAPAR